tara:strand:+ start:174 stop:467 length:294 start_codon:yes stop_codon:yes gene_type:complete
VQWKKCHHWQSGRWKGDRKNVAIKGGAILPEFVGEKRLGLTPWLSATSCSATASHTGLRSAVVQRAITNKLTSLPSVAGRLLRIAPVINGRYTNGEV